MCQMIHVSFNKTVLLSIYSYSQHCLLKKKKKNIQKKKKNATDCHVTKKLVMKHKTSSPVSYKTFQTLYLMLQSAGIGDPLH